MNSLRHGFIFALTLLLALLLIGGTAGCSSAPKKKASSASTTLGGIPLVSLPETQIFIEGEKGALTELDWQYYTQPLWTSQPRYALRVWIRLPKGYSLDSFESNDSEITADKMPQSVFSEAFEKDKEHHYFGVDLQKADAHFKAKIIETETQESRESNFVVSTHIRPPILETHASCPANGVEFVSALPEMKEHTVSPFLAIHCEMVNENRLQVNLFYPSDAALWQPSVAEWGKTPGKALWYFDLTDVPSYKKTLLTRFYVHSQNTSYRYDIYWNPRAFLR